jgi:hypothetical protein
MRGDQRGGNREAAEALAREFDESSRREGLKRNRVCPFSQPIIHNEEIRLGPIARLGELGVRMLSDQQQRQ